MAAKAKDVEEHGWRETRNFSPNDQLLRRAGFRIHDRAKNLEPIWEKGGKLYRESVALDEAVAMGEA